jgi:hypothetical protein
MSYRSVEAGRGASWIREGYELVMRNPGVFLTMALILAVLQAIPLLNLAMVVLGAALFGGFLWAMREQDAGRPAELRHLFTAFQVPGKLGPMIVLCLPASRSWSRSRDRVRLDRLGVHELRMNGNKPRRRRGRRDSGSPRSRQ